MGRAAEEEELLEWPPAAGAELDRLVEAEVEAEAEAEVEVGREVVERWTDVEDADSGPVTGAADGAPLQAATVRTAAAATPHRCLAPIPSGPPPPCAS